MLRKPQWTTGAHPCWTQSVGIDNVFATLLTSSLSGALPSGTTIQSGPRAKRASRTALNLIAKFSKGDADCLIRSYDLGVRSMLIPRSPSAFNQSYVAKSSIVRNALATGRASAIGRRYLTNFGWITTNKTLGGLTPLPS